MKWRRWFLGAKDYFSFNRAERRAVVGLSWLVLAIWGSVWATQHYAQRTATIPPYLFQDLQLAYEKKYHIDTNSYKRQGTRYYPKKNYKTYSSYPKHYTTPFYDTLEKNNLIQQKFNPNYVDSAFWVQAGLSPKQALVLLKYKTKSGGFEFKEDLKKVIVISEAFYAKIAPWVDLPEQGILALNPFAPEPVDVNLSEDAIWSRLPGIKEWQIKHILRYRKAIGAFYSIEQLRDIYGVGSYHYEQWKPYLIITPQPIKKLNVNYCGWRELADYPFFSNGLARVIVDYRNEHGNFKSWDIWIRQGWVSSEDIAWLDVYFKL